MAFKDDIEAMCAKAIRDNRDVIVKLPQPPLNWPQQKIDERFFQLVHLIKLNGCDISKVNLTDYKIHKIVDKD